MEAEEKVLLQAPIGSNSRTVDVHSVSGNTISHQSDNSIVAGVFLFSA